MHEAVMDKLYVYVMFKTLCIYVLKRRKPFTVEIIGKFSPCRQTICVNHIAVCARRNFSQDYFHSERHLNVQVYMNLLNITSDINAVIYRILILVSVIIH